MFCTKKKLGDVNWVSNALKPPERLTLTSLRRPPSNMQSPGKKQIYAQKRTIYIIERLAMLVL